MVPVLALLLAMPAAANSKYAGLVIDAKNGKVLYSSHADSYRYPASLTKMMTLYMLFEALESGRVTKKTRIRFSRHAASMQPTKLGVRAGGSISAEQAIYALVTKSANDAAAAVAEHLGKTESNFARMMTQKARAMGMSKTTFRNASGLPDRRQRTTARDMATLGIALREHFPQYYKYFSARSFKFGKRRFGNHNRLLGTVRGVDGIKTGYTRASGFNLVSSVRSNERSIVAVVMGGRSGKRRNAHMADLIRRYLPSASRGKDRILVAKTPRASYLTALLELPKTGPVPQSSPLYAARRDPRNKRVVEAHSVALAYQREEIGSGSEIALVEAQLGRMGATKLPVPVAKPTPQADPMTTGSIGSVLASSRRPAGAPPNNRSAGGLPATAPEGWHVQIGAMPSLENAIRELEKARKKAPTLLASVANYTETVESNGTTLYRARFAGFASKSEAWGACKALKKKRYDCLALPN